MPEEKKTNSEIAAMLLEIAIDLRDIRNKMLDVKSWSSIATGTDTAERYVTEALQHIQLDLGAFTFYDRVDPK